LNLGPFASERAAETLTLAQHGLFLSEVSKRHIIVVVSEARGSFENLILERCEEGVLERRACMFFLVKFLESVEKCAHEWKPLGTLV
jgi:hypothetical protein